MKECPRKTKKILIGQLVKIVKEDREWFDWVTAMNGTTGQIHRVTETMSDDISPYRQTYRLSNRFWYPRTCLEVI